VSKAEKIKKKPGTKPHEPTAQLKQQVTMMTGFGIPQDDIAKIIGMSTPTLIKFYSNELDTARAQLNTKVANNLFRQATKDDFKAIPAAIFWCKTRMGWREVTRHEHGGADGAPIPVQMNLSKATDAELAALTSLFGTVASVASGDTATDPSGDSEA
jgi:hypothetical protein